MITNVAMKLGKEAEFKDLSSNFQKVIDSTKEIQKNLEADGNIHSYEQSINIINCRYELIEVLFRPIATLGGFYNEELGTILRNTFSIMTRNHEVSQAYLSGAIELGGAENAVKGGKVTKGGTTNQVFGSDSSQSWTL